MRKILWLFLAIVLLLSFIAIKNNDPRLVILGLNKKLDILPAELKYRVYLLGILPVGEAVFTIPAKEEYLGQPVLHLTATARNANFFSKFISSHAVLDSYIDAQQFNPILFRQRLAVKGKAEISKEVIYDQKEGIMSIAGVRRQILPNTQDPLSAVFNIRRIDFGKTKDFEMNLNTNQKNYILKGRAEQKKLSVGKKLYNITTVKAEIKRRDKNPYHKSNITMVLLKEKENIPILLTVFAGGFLINAKLIDTKI